jgi:hypothetical protein
MARPARASEIALTVFPSLRSSSPALCVRPVRPGWEVSGRAPFVLMERYGWALPRRFLTPFLPRGIAGSLPIGRGGLVARRGA